MQGTERCVTPWLVVCFMGEALIAALKKNIYISCTVQESFFKTILYVLAHNGLQMLTSCILLFFEFCSFCASSIPLFSFSFFHVLSIRFLPSSFQPAFFRCVLTLGTS